MLETLKNLVSGLNELITKVEELDNRTKELEEKLNESVNATENVEVEPIKTTENVDTDIEVKEPEQLQIEFTSEEPKENEVPAVAPRKHIPGDIHDIAVAMYKKGCSLQEISVEVNIPLEKLRNHIYKTVTLKEREKKGSECKISGNRRWEGYEAPLAIEMRKRGCSLQEIAERLKRTVHSVSKKLSKINNGIDSQFNPDGTVKTKA